MLAEISAKRLSILMLLPLLLSSAPEPGMLTGNSVVKREDVTYKAIQLGIKQGGTFVPLSSSIDPINPGTVRMVVGADTTLYVMAQRSDNNKWEEVPASWIVGGLTTETPAPSGSQVSWNMKPTAATPTNASGTVTVSMSGVSVRVNVIVEYGDPAAARFFIKSGTPSFDTAITVFRDERSGKARMYAVPNSSVELIAGARMPIVGRLFSSTVVSAETWLNNTPGGAWTWAPVAGSPSPGNCTDCGIRVENPSLRGDSATFMSTAAHNTYQIRGTYKDNFRGITITQDIWIRVIPDASGPALVIEPNSQGLTISPNAPQRVGELAFAESDWRKVVYAVIRDKYGNFVCPSGAQNPYPPPAGGGTTDWTTSKNIVALEPGSALLGEVKINRAEYADGSALIVTAKNTAWSNVSDNVNVIFKGYDYDDIRIVKVCDGSGGRQLFVKSDVNYCDVGDTLKINSNQEKLIYVFGKRNDCDVSGVTGNACWEAIDGNWSRDAGLVSALSSPPNGTSGWTLSPTSSGIGRIVVNRPDSDMSDAINVKITVGPPLRAELVITTPADQLIAGKEISAIVNYYNRAGLMTEWDPSWNPAKGSLFADTLGLGPIAAKPKVKSENENDLCYQGGGCQSSHINAALPHNAANLNDVVKFVVYYAADGHQIRYNESLTVNGSPFQLTCQTLSFTVKAGEPARIEIQGSGERKIDTLKVSQGDPEQILHAVASDEYGNRIGDYSSNWSATAPIPVDFKDRSIIVYTPGMAEDNGRGQLCVDAMTASNRRFTDCIIVDLTGVTVRPLSAVTKDDDGCGYLDKIVMKFRKPVTFAGEDIKTKVKPGADKITVNYSAKNFRWTVDSVTVKPVDSTATIWLNDAVPHVGELQTGWTPVVNIIAKDFFDEAGSQSIQTTDGAPPVIATAKLYFPKESTGKTAENYIEVTFSEKVKSSDGTPFGVNKNEANTKFLPAELFNIWGKKGLNKAETARTRTLSKKAGDLYDKSQFDVQKDRLVGITRTVYMDESTLRFYLENGMGISPPNDYINIRTQDADMYQNKNPNSLTVVRDVPDNVPLADNRLTPITFGNEPGGSRNNSKVSVVLKNNPFTSGGSRSVSVLMTPIMSQDGQDVINIISASIVLSDKSGALVADTLIDGADGGSIDWSWNGANKRGRFVSTGTYLFKVVLTARRADGIVERYDAATRYIGVVRGKNNFTTGKSPASKFSGEGAVGFFWDGGGIEGGTLSVYDASGNLVRKIGVGGKSAGESGERKIGEWDLTDAKGRVVAEGSYLVTGVIKAKSGERERVSTIVGVGR